MNTSQATLVMVLLFALRCLLPLAIMLGIGYAMNWMVNRWEMEAEGNNEGAAVGAVVINAENATDRCWSILKCDPELRKNCPGFKQQMVPCWLARTRAEGALPEKCITCPLYKETPSYA